MIIIELFILAYFIYVVGYTAFFSVAAIFYQVPRLKFDFLHSKFCVLIPAYKEDGVLPETVCKALDQSYPAEHFEVVVIGDGLQPSTIADLRHLPIKVIEVSFEESTKVKSLNKAMEQLPDTFDYAVILDADNIIAPDFLEKINDLIYSTQYKAIQGQRKAKNNSTKLSILDGLSEAINNHIYRQGSSALNLSSSISGSGMAIDYKLLKKNLNSMTSIGGFDRELELMLLRDGVKVFYYKDAHVLDEKVSDAKVFGNQRKRWISSQYFYLKKYFKEGMLSLFKGDFVFFNSAVLRNIQLPRLINLGLLVVLCVGLYFIKDSLHYGYAWWPILFAINALAIAASIPEEYYSYKLLKSIFELPRLFLQMTSLLFKMKGANKKFLHTPHTPNTIKS